MVRAWYTDGCDAERTSPHMTEPPRYVKLDYLEQKCGVKIYQVDTTCPSWEDEVKKLREDGNYLNGDEVTVRPGSSAYEKIDTFYTEHIHVDNEARFVSDGTGYFDVRDIVGNKEEWIRIEVEQGDFIILPAGIYHRFALDTKEYFRVRRYFSDAPSWEALPRPQDQHPGRLSYVQKYCQH